MVAVCFAPRAISLLLPVNPRLRLPGADTDGEAKCNRAVFIGNRDHREAHSTHSEHGSALPFVPAVTLG